MKSLGWISSDIKDKFTGILDYKYIICECVLNYNLISALIFLVIAGMFVLIETKNKVIISKYNVKRTFTIIMKLKRH